MGAKNYTRKYIKGKLGLKAGDKISMNGLNNSINYLTRTNNFNSIHYSFVKKDSLADLTLNIKENPRSTYLKLGGHYDATYKLAGLLNFTQKHLFFQNDILSLDLALGDNFRYEFNYFIDNGSFLSYGLYSRFHQLNTSIHTTNINRQRINLDFNDFTNYLYAQINYKNALAIFLGIEHKHIRTFTNTYATFPYTNRTYFDRSDYLNFLSKFELDTYDKKVFPNNGYLIQSTFRNYLASTDFNHNFVPASQLRVLVEAVKTISNRFSLLLQADGGLTFTTQSQQNINFELGGYGNNFINNYIPFYGYTFGQLSGGSFLKSAASFRYRFYKKQYLDFSANYAIVANDIVKFLEREPFFKNAKTGYSIGYGLDTFLGPFEIRYAWSPENERLDGAVYFSVGFWF